MIHIKWQELLPYPANMSKKNTATTSGLWIWTVDSLTFLFHYSAMAKTAKRRLLQAFRLKRTSPNALPIFTYPPASFPTYPPWHFPICGLASSCLSTFPSPSPTYSYGQS
jgi:hypothetical protein